MTEDQEDLNRGFRRAATGLGVIAIGWVLAILLGERPDDSPLVWAIPVGAVLLGILFYSQSRRIGSSQE
jgi:hypothetical protein